MEVDEKNVQARCFDNASKNYADSKNWNPVTRCTVPRWCKEHSALKVRVRTAQIQKMNSGDAEKPKNTPIEDTTENVKNKHESAKPGAETARTTG